MTEKEAIEKLKGLAVPVHAEPAFDMAIDALEKICTKEQKSSWIPCTERLPDKFRKVLVTFIPSAGSLWIKVIIAHYSDLMGTVKKPCFWIGKYGKGSFKNISEQVIAWMPLPEPYRED